MASKLSFLLDTRGVAVNVSPSQQSLFSEFLSEELEPLRAVCLDTEAVLFRHGESSNSVRIVGRFKG